MKQPVRFAGSSATVNAVLVEVSKGNDVEAVGAHIERWLHFSAYTTASTTSRHREHGGRP